MSALSQPFALRGATMRNRIMVSPMCTYACAADGLATDWQFAHYGRLAMGGAGLVMLEATAIDPVGRHSYADLGIWSEAHVAPLRRIADFIRSQGAVPAIQLQHAGRKSSARRPWHGATPLTQEDKELRGEEPWQALGPSPAPVSEGRPIPVEIEAERLPELVGLWVEAARRAVSAGFDVIEIHAAHGYLLNQFLSPIANQRQDRYGGSLENRMRFPLEAMSAVRAALPETSVLMVRLSVVDGVEEGWTLAESIVLGKRMKEIGIDAIDCSSGGIGGAATMNRMARSPGFQVPFAEALRREVGVPTVAVGLILTPEQAEAVVAEGRADIVAIGREFLADPNWANRTLTQLDGSYDHWPQEAGWWLDKRAAILRDYEREQGRAGSQS
jgi:2,4-dienoyl-CoA reductase-like NADH-dependent reductase (Old Yellow Enzyme family)